MRLRVFHVARAYLVSIFFWFVLCLLTGWNYQIFDRTVHIQSTLWQMIILAESAGLAYALLTPPVFYWVRRTVSRTKIRAPQILMYAAGVVPFALILSVLRWVILPGWDPGTLHFISHADSSPLDAAATEFANILTLYCSILLAAHVYAYVERTRNLDLERAQYHEALTASQLQILRMQLHPHFLFNTLHGISSLIDSDRETAKVTIVKLSDLLRKALRRSDSDLVTLQEELSFVDGYLDIERIRFSDRLNVRTQIEPDTLEILVPQFIVQLLVENALRHGVATSLKPSWIEISARLQDRVIEIEVRNSVGRRGPDSGGLGLKNTRERLRHLYGDDATLNFLIDESHKAIAKLTFPALQSVMQQPQATVEVQPCAS